MFVDMRPVKRHFIAGPQHFAIARCAFRAKKRKQTSAMSTDIHLKMAHDANVVLHLGELTKLVNNYNYNSAE